MTALIAEVAALLAQGQALPDTIVTKQVPTAQGWFGTFTGIADALMTVAILVLTVALVPAAWNFRKSYKRVNELLEKVYGDVSPIVRHAHTVADNLDYVTTSIRVDIQQVNQTVAAANRRLLRAVDLAERRVRELNALVDVVQREAEDVFVSTASTVRGVRAGVASLRRDLEETTDADDLASLEEPGDAPDEIDAAWPDLAPEMGESTDGDDSATTSTEPTERPRVRRRPGPRHRA